MRHRRLTEPCWVFFSGSLLRTAAQRVQKIMPKDNVSHLLGKLFWTFMKDRAINKVSRDSRMPHPWCICCSPNSTVLLLYTQYTSTNWQECILYSEKWIYPSPLAKLVVFFWTPCNCVCQFDTQTSPICWHFDFLYTQCINMQLPLINVFCYYSDVNTFIYLSTLKIAFGSSLQSDDVITYVSIAQSKDKCLKIRCTVPQIYLPIFWWIHMWFDSILLCDSCCCFIFFGRQETT